MARTEKPLSGYRFLIIEDEIMQAWQLSGLVADMGGVVDTMAYSFDQASHALKHASFDCAIIDLNLAGIYAYQIAETLKQRGIPFIFCSAYADHADVFAGMSDTPRLSKPVDPGELYDALFRVLRSDPGGKR